MIIIMIFYLFKRVHFRIEMWVFEHVNNCIQMKLMELFDVISKELDGNFFDCN